MNKRMSKGTLYINGEEFCKTNNIDFNGSVNNIAELNYKTEFTSFSNLSLKLTGKIKIYPEAVLLFDESLKYDSRFIKLKNQFYKTRKNRIQKKIINRIKRLLK